MAVSADIYRMFAPKSASEFTREYETEQAAKQARQMNALQMLAQQRSMESAERGEREHNALAALLSSGFDRRAPDAQQRLYATAPRLAQGVMKGWAEQDKAAAELDKTKVETKRIGAQATKEQFDTAAAQMKAVYDATSTAVDQASYERAIAGLRAMGVELSNVPPQFDPAFVSQAGQMALTNLQRIEQARLQAQAEETKRSNVARETETGRHNRASEQTAAGQLGVSQATLGLSRERLALDRAAPRGVLDPERGLLVDPRTGEARPITVGGKAVGAKASTGAATESERTAGFLLQRIRDSQRQLSAAVTEQPSAAKPGLAQEGARIVSEPLANSMTGENRQRVESAQLDILDAALTLGTGAAYTREQLQGYRKSYFPQIGDSAKAVADKQERLNNLIRAAETKAGRSAADTGNKPSAPGLPTAEAIAAELARRGAK